MLYLKRKFLGEQFLKICCVIFENKTTTKYDICYKNKYQHKVKSERVNRTQKRTHTIAMKQNHTACSSSKRKKQKLIFKNEPL